MRGIVDVLAGLDLLRFARQACILSALLIGNLGTLLLSQSFPAGSVSSVIISPAASNTLYASTAGGVYKSTDGGRQWTWSGLASVNDLTFDPANSSTLYAATSFGVSKTRDGWAKLDWSAPPAKLCLVNRSHPGKTRGDLCGHLRPRSFQES